MKIVEYRHSEEIKIKTIVQKQKRRKKGRKEGRKKTVFLLTHEPLKLRNIRDEQ